MGYRWGQHQELLRKLYVEDGQSLDSVMHYMKETYDFAPCKRRYQTQFRTWGFIKNSPAAKNEQLVSRIKELWDANVRQSTMLDTLHAEGFRVSALDISRVRRKNKWYLRAPPPEITTTASSERVGVNTTRTSRGAGTPQKGGAKGASIPPFERKKPSKLSKSLRFPSQVSTSIAQERIGIDKPTYKTMRVVFKRICNDDGIIRKAEPGISVWEAAKVKLCSEILQLHIAMAPSADEEETRLKQISLDVICMDVAKGMRVSQATDTVTEVRNTLGINPEESRQIRSIFMEILEEANFGWKSNASPEQWAELNKLWASRSPLVARSVASREGGQAGVSARTAALESIAMNGLRRYQDSKTKQTTRGANKASSSSTTHAPQLSTTVTLDAEMPSFGEDAGNLSFPDVVASQDPPRQTRRSTRATTNTMVSQPLAQSSQRRNPPKPAKPTRSNVPAAMTLASHVHHTIQPAMSATNEQTFFMAAPAFPSTVYQQTDPTSTLFYQTPTAFAVYFRLHPSSSFASAASLWISTLRSSSVHDLRVAAAVKFPGTMCLRVEGIVKDGNGGEIPLQINQDDEMMAYMEHLQGSTPTFSVQLVWKTS